MTGVRILFAEDDETIAAHVVASLSASGFEVVRVAEGPRAWELGDTEPFDCVVLDLGLPGLDGMTLLKRWRREGNRVPVLVLTARGSWMERVDGFEAGADDYLPKPFRAEELIARLKALLRRAGARPAAAAASSASGFQVDEDRMTVRLDGTPLVLTPTEYRALSHLVRNADKVVSAYDLAAHVQGRDDEVAKNAVEALIGRLRRKIGPDRIVTRRGFGYIIAGDDE